MRSGPHLRLAYRRGRTEVAQEEGAARPPLPQFLGGLCGGRLDDALRERLARTSSGRTNAALTRGGFSDTCLRPADADHHPCPDDRPTGARTGRHLNVGGLVPTAVTTPAGATLGAHAKRAPGSGSSRSRRPGCAPTMTLKPDVGGDAQERGGVLRRSEGRARRRRTALGTADLAHGIAP